MCYSYLQVISHYYYIATDEVCEFFVFQGEGQGKKQIVECQWYPLLHAYLYK